MDKTSWSAKTKKIFNGILLFSLAWIAYGIFEPIESLFSFASSGLNVMGAVTGVSTPSLGVSGTVLTIITYLLLAGIGYGCVLTIAALGSFSAILDDGDESAVLTVRTGFIIALAAVVLDMIPFIPGIIGDIAYFVAILLMLMGYNNLKGSTTFAGKDGASILFVAMLLLLIGWVLDFIPLVGDWIEAILTIVAYIMTLVGWSKIKNAAIAE
jgi:hypothetical protein